MVQPLLELPACDATWPGSSVESHSSCQDLLFKDEEGHWLEDLWDVDAFVLVKILLGRNHQLRVLSLHYLKHMATGLGALVTQAVDAALFPVHDLLYCRIDVTIRIVLWNCCLPVSLFHPR